MRPSPIIGAVVVQQRYGAYPDLRFYMNIRRLPPWILIRTTMVPADTLLLLPVVPRNTSITAIEEYSKVSLPCQSSFRTIREERRRESEAGRSISIYHDHRHTLVATPIMR